MRISDWSSDVCSSDLGVFCGCGCCEHSEEILYPVQHTRLFRRGRLGGIVDEPVYVENHVHRIEPQPMEVGGPAAATVDYMRHHAVGLIAVLAFGEAVPESLGDPPRRVLRLVRPRSEEHTSELQSLMRISYAVFCLKQKTERIENRLHQPH